MVERAMVPNQWWARAGTSPLEVGNIAAGVLAVVLMVIAGQGYGGDAAAYWHVDPFHPYSALAYGQQGGFFYSPVVALFAAPLGLIPWPLFVSGILVLNLAALYWLVGRWIGYALLLPPVMSELLAGNVNLLVGVAVAAAISSSSNSNTVIPSGASSGSRISDPHVTPSSSSRRPTMTPASRWLSALRWTSTIRFTGDSIRPALWAFVLLTKVTPGIGLLWFAVRREWGSLGIALGITLGLCAVSFFVAPDAWRQWLGLLMDNSAGTSPLAFPVPLAIRLPLAALLTVYAARTDRPWLVPVAAFLGVAVIWRLHYVILLGVWKLWTMNHSTAASLYRVPSASSWKASS